MILHISGSEKRTGKKLKMEKLCKVRKDSRLFIYQKTEIMPKDEVQDMYVWAMITGWSHVAWPLHNSSNRVLPLLEEMWMNETQQKLWILMGWRIALTSLLLPAVLPNYWSYSPVWQWWPWSWSSVQSPVLPTLPSSPCSAFRAAFSLSPVSA